MPRFPQLAAACALVVVATACSSRSDDSSARPQGKAAPSSVSASRGSDGVQQVSIGATSNFRFEPSTVAAHPGRVRVTLTDVGSYPHNLSVAELHATSDTVTGSPGEQSTTFTLDFPRPGTYSFVCTFHSSAGMRGQFDIR